MTREIKFRAWTGEKMINNITPWQRDFVIDRMSWKCIDSNGEGILGSGGTEGKFEVYGYSFKEIMQYTGLRDKNGKEIYEGDIVNYKDMYKMEVYWNNTLVCYLLYNLIERYFNELVAENDCEVIGNIYENPELVKESK